LRILNLSLLRLNDSHSYYGGAIGSIGYELLSSLSSLDDVDVISFTQGTDLSLPVPSSLNLVHATSFSEVKKLMPKYLEGEKETILTHFYFHEPVHTPISHLANKLDSPFVIGMCELPHYRLRDEVSGPLKSHLLRKVGKTIAYMPRFKKTLSHCDRLITVNGAAKQYYSKYFPTNQIGIIPYGVNQELFPYTPLPKEPRILVVSRLIRRRGIDALIDALPDILSEIPDVHLDIIGDGPQHIHLKQQASKNGVLSRVHFYGNVSAEALVQHYQNCSVFCHLSNSDGWNQPALEAMSTGRPVIGLDAHHNSMVLNGTTGFLISPEKINSLSNYLIQILDDGNLCSQMGTSAHELISTNYNLSTVAKQYVTEFKRLL
tara:strand:- start:451 stop:1575 length:1125 start_codon:yes stop_codon:yes gene_type:complete